MSRLYFSLLWRPGTLLWLFWIAGINMGFSNFDFGRQILLAVTPLFGGLLLAQPVRDLQSRDMSWVLPSLRRRLFPSLIVMLALCSAITVLALQPKLPFVVGFGLAFMFASIGSSLKTDQVAFVQFRPNFSLVSWSLCFAACVRFDLVLHMAATLPIQTLLVSTLVTCIYLHHVTSIATHRTLMQENFFSLLNSLNPKALGTYTRQIRASRSSNRVHSFGWVHFGMGTAAWIRASYLESFGYLGFAHFMFRFVLIVGLITLGLGVSFARGIWGSLIPLLVLVFAFQYPLRVRATLPRPMARKNLWRCVLWASWVETIVLMSIVVALLSLFEFWKPPVIQVSEQFRFAYESPRNLWPWLASTFTFLPISQYARRRYGFSISSILFVLAISFFLTTGYTWLLSKGTADFSPIARTCLMVLGSLTSHTLYVFLIRNYAKSVDIKPNST